MSKKKKKGGKGKPFTGSSDPRNNRGAPSVISDISLKKRYDRKFVTQACENEHKRNATDLPGLFLRPKSTTPRATPPTDDSANDIVDLEKMKLAQCEALKLHQQYVTNRRRRPAVAHIVSLIPTKVANMGFGVSIRYKCKQCHFLSPVYKLYATTATGGCATNLQAGVALTKVPIKSSDASFLFSTLNLNAPDPKTLAKHFNRSCSIASDVLEESLTENRAVVHDYLTLVGRNDNSECPSASVSLDGQFNRPVYHGYNGQSTFVSEPVLENETSQNLMVSYAVASKLDGSYDVNKVNSILNFKGVRLKSNKANGARGMLAM